ncbi:sel1 repeat family protein [Ferruginivarius sediminum]|uniref:Sel1 repeat family protein n=2 Tax=Ferruginivarius sediminum TaxID=2661937 RepID=A0A369T653_9PROT|nr:sel1 repeat family protein [Ferruginivarius sediminum]
MRIVPGGLRVSMAAATATAVAAALFSVAPLSPAGAASYATASQLYDGGQVEAAIAEYRELAESGHAAAQVALAGLYESGEVTGAPDARAAARWYRRAAEQGEAVAQMNLGDLYARGRGVKRDWVRAWVWLTRAARQGFDWAARRRDEVARRMTRPELEAARRRLSGTAPDIVGGD